MKRKINHRRDKGISHNPVHLHQGILKSSLNLLLPNPKLTQVGQKHSWKGQGMHGVMRGHSRPTLLSSFSGCPALSLTSSMACIRHSSWSEPVFRLPHPRHQQKMSHSGPHDSHSDKKWCPLQRTCRWEKIHIGFISKFKFLQLDRSQPGSRKDLLNNTNELK